MLLSEAVPVTADLAAPACHRAGSVQGIGEIPGGLALGLAEKFAVREVGPVRGILPAAGGLIVAVRGSCRAEASC